ncbi:hypothetical protein GmHk_17G049323 [Glycine max]|nr:hypothetical protein GmHk_17G049323 [Glycine max]
MKPRVERAFHVGIRHKLIPRSQNHHICQLRYIRNSKGKVAMHMQAPTISLNIARSPSSLAAAANAGMRPHLIPMALKSSFFSGSLNLLLHPMQQYLTSGAPRISMRVASKQAYICRDCGIPFIFSLTLYH